MSRKFFAFLYRMKHIERWSLMRNTQKENIAEHSYYVAVLAHTLGVIRRDVFGVPCEPERFALAASYHNGTSDGSMLRGDRRTPQGAIVERVRRGYSLGGQARFGAFTVTVDVTRDTKNEQTGRWGWNNTLASWQFNNKKFTNAVLEGKYALSKRTFLYADFLRDGEKATEKKTEEKKTKKEKK